MHTKVAPWEELNCTGPFSALYLVKRPKRTIFCDQPFTTSLGKFFNSKFVMTTIQKILIPDSSPKVSGLIVLRWRLVGLYKLQFYENLWPYQFMSTTVEIYYCRVFSSSFKICWETDLESIANFQSSPAPLSFECKIDSRTSMLRRSILTFRHASGILRAEEDIQTFYETDSTELIDGKRIQSALFYCIMVFEQRRLELAWTDADKAIRSIVMY